jgi:sarcosine oxidase subunit alpha
MSQRFRTGQGGRVDREQEIQFTFNGKRYTGLVGDTLCSALLANGVHLVGRSWKYHRPRGVVSAGAEEPNALFQLEKGKRTIPNARGTQVELYPELDADSVNCWPSLEFDLLSINSWFARLSTSFARPRVSASHRASPTLIAMSTATPIATYW